MKRIFIACPIGNDASEERKRSDTLMDYVIAPVVKEVLGAEYRDECVVRSDKISQPGRITVQILKELKESDVVIADLTGPNSNVMYELGIRQALIRPYVIMALQGQVLPFDLNDFRTIFYSLDLPGADKAKSELAKHLKVALEGGVHEIDRELFSKSPSDRVVTEPVVTSNNVNIDMYSALAQVLREIQDTKQYVLTIGNIVIDLRDLEKQKVNDVKEARTQELGLALLSKMLDKPQSISKTMDAFKMIADFGAKAQAEQTPPNVE